MANPTKLYNTSVGLQQPAAADLSDGTTGTGAVVQAGSPTLTGSPAAPTPTTGDNTTKLATTAFVTTAITNAVSGINPAVAVQAASATILPNSPTYLNGVGGIGATITAGVTNTTLVVDGYTPILNDRILVKNESGGGGLGAGKNGVYFVSQLAALGLAWTLTRALDYDQPSDINSTGAIPVVNGTVNGITQWVLTSSITAVDGTQALTYAQFSVNPSTLAPLASPAFTGTPTAPTATVGTSTTQIATTAFVTGSSSGSLSVTSWRRKSLISADGGGTNLTSPWGDEALNNGGTLSLVLPTSTHETAVSIVPSLSTANGWSGLLNYRTGKNISYYCNLCLNRLTNQRVWICLTDQTIGTIGASDNPAGNYAGFRFSTVVGDTVWQCITKDGTTQAVTSSAVAPIANTGQNFAMIFNDSIPNIVFYINGAVVATISSNLPTSGTNLRYVVVATPSVNTTLAGFSFSQQYIEHDSF